MRLKVTNAEVEVNIYDVIDENGKDVKYDADVDKDGDIRISVDLQDLHSEIESLKEERSDLEARISELENDVSSLERQLEEAENN